MTFPTTPAARKHRVGSRGYNNLKTYKGAAGPGKGVSTITGRALGEQDIPPGMIRYGVERNTVNQLNAAKKKKRRRNFAFNPRGGFAPAAIARRLFKATPKDIASMNKNPELRKGARMRDQKRGSFVVGKRGPQ